MNTEYVSEILDKVPVGLTRVGFSGFCESDVNAGYRAEVDEAWKRYQAQGLAARRQVRR